jgi:hypothetical protein
MSAIHDAMRQAQRDRANGGDMEQLLKDSIAVAEGAALETKMTAPKRTLVSKLAEVMAAVGWIQKSGYNEFHKYSYAQEADLVNAIRGELAKRHIMAFPNVVSCERKPHEIETMKWDDDTKKKLPSTRKTQLTEIIVEWTFVDGESGEERTIKVPGVGEDNVDKGFYKAFTGSEKYALMKTFLIPTGDDPEKDSKDEAEDAKLTGKAAAKQVAEKKLAKARQVAAEPEKAPELSFRLLEGDLFEVSGPSETMNAHKELLLSSGKRKGDKVIMEAGKFEDFKFIFVDQRHGKLKKS